MIRFRLPVIIALILSFTAFASAKEYTGWKADVEKLIREAKFSTALERLVAVESTVEKDADFYFLRAKSRTGNMQFKQAREDIEKALEMEPNFPEALGHKSIIQLNDGHADKAIETATRAIEKQEDAELYYARGAAYTATGQFEKAIQDLDTAMVLTSDKAEYYIARGEVENRLKRYKQAMNDFTRAIELEPESPRPYLGRGGLYLMTGERVKARQDFDRCLEIDPNFALAYLRRAKLWEMDGKIDKSVEDYRKASEAMPRSDEAWFGRTMAEMAGSNYEQAEQSARHLLKISNHTNRAHKVMATVLAARGKREEAIKHFSLALEFNSRDVESMYLRGSTYAYMKKFDEAINDFDRAIEILPDYLDPYLSKANVLVVQRKHDDAFALFADLLIKDPNNYIVLQHRSELYKALGKFDEAMADLEGIAEIKKRIQKARENRKSE